MDHGPELERARAAFFCCPDQDHGPRIMDQDPSLNIMDHGSGFIFIPGDERAPFLSYPGINKGMNMGSSSQGLKTANMGSSSQGIMYYRFQANT